MLTFSSSAFSKPDNSIWICYNSRNEGWSSIFYYKQLETKSVNLVNFFFFLTTKWSVFFITVGDPTSPCRLFPFNIPIHPAALNAYTSKNYKTNTNSNRHQTKTTKPTQTQTYITKSPETVTGTKYVLNSLSKQDQTYFWGCNTSLRNIHITKILRTLPKTSRHNFSNFDLFCSL